MEKHLKADIGLNIEICFFSPETVLDARLEGALKKIALKRIRINIAGHWLHTRPVKYIGYWFDEF